MSLRLRASLLGCAAACLPAATAPAQRVTLLPEASLRLAAIRYAQSEPQFRWSGWIGGGFGLLRLGGTTLRLDADLETIIGDERRAFDANQANYHLEAGARQALGALQVEVFFHHVSRHLEDRPKAQAVDWNVLGLRVVRSSAGARPARVSLGAGRISQVSLVGYRWELTGQAGLELPLRGGEGAAPRPAALYADVDLRYVQADATPEFPRDGFLDARLEGGLRLRRASRRAALFAAFERRNDVLPLEPGARSRLLLGLRLSLEP